MKKIMIILLVITLPVGSFFLVWSYNVIASYSSFEKVSVRNSAKGKSLYPLGLAEYVSPK